MRSWLQFVGRVFIAAVFIFSIIGHLMDFSGMQAFMAKYGMPYTAFFLAASLAVRALGSASIVLGYKTGWGVALLTLFLVPTTLIFHTNFGDPMEMIAFLENLGLEGGLLLLAASGPGELALDEPRPLRAARARHAVRI